MSMKDSEKPENEKSENLFSEVLIKIKNLGNNSLFGSNDESINSKQDKNSDSEKGEKKGISHTVIWLCIIAVAALFAIRMFGLGGETGEKTEPAEKSRETITDENMYVNDMEADLKEILEKIEGAGNVSVRIYIDSTAEKILAEDSKNESEVSEDKDGKTESSSGERSTVIASGGGGISNSGSPYVVREKLPYPIGVVVVADGAKNERVRTEMYEAVKALYGLSANRIKITY